MSRSYGFSPPWCLHGGSGTALLYFFTCSIACVVKTGCDQYSSAGELQNEQNKTEPKYRLGIFKIENKQIRYICFLMFGNTVKTGNCINSATRLSWYIDVTKSYE
jgi:hypothetical protein